MVKEIAEGIIGLVVAKLNPVDFAIKYLVELFSLNK